MSRNDNDNHLIVDRARRSIKKYGYRGFMARLLFDAYAMATAAYIRRQNFAGRFIFEDRQKKRDHLIVVLAGYKSFLWPLVIPRLAARIDNRYDVCIASSGVDDERLRTYCEKYGWSYLVTKKNKVGLAVNLAIKAHECADFIHKMDEDIFVTMGMFEKIERTYHHVLKSGAARPGACAPLLNINGYTYRFLLDHLELRDRFKSTFGSDGYFHPHQVFNNPESVVFLWRHCLPLESLGVKLEDADLNYSLTPVRFSIGVIFFERSFWNELGGFRVGSLSGTLGLDEEIFCKECVDRFRPIVAAHSALAGHFSFFHQERAMRDALEELGTLDPDCFGISEA